MSGDEMDVNFIDFVLREGVIYAQFSRQPSLREWNNDTRKWELPPKVVFCMSRREVVHHARNYFGHFGRKCPERSFALRNWPTPIINSFGHINLVVLR